jgi:hypothetical protein
MGVCLLWKVLFKHIRPVSTSVDFLGYQFITGIALHETRQPRLEGRQVGFDEEVATRAKVFVNRRGKNSYVWPEVENIDR